MFKRVLLGGLPAAVYWLLLFGSAPTSLASELSLGCTVSDGKVSEVGAKVHDSEYSFELFRKMKERGFLPSLLPRLWVVDPDFEPKDVLQIGKSSPLQMIQVVNRYQAFGSDSSSADPRDFLYADKDRNAISSERYGNR